MRYALIENERREATPKLKGTCPACDSPVLARCGRQRVWHWAHRGVRNCDPWWETETEWHRAWKHNFQEDWQEVICYAPSGEKHIADVHTPHGLTIEFQHSHLRPDEREGREAFYGNMIWIVDGSRLKGDRPRFEKNKDLILSTDVQGIGYTALPDEVLPRGWLSCTTPVCFDFRNDDGKPAEALICLLPGRVRNKAVIMKILREDLISAMRGCTQPIALDHVRNQAGRCIIERERKADNDFVAAFAKQLVARRAMYSGRRRL